MDYSLSQLPPLLSGRTKLYAIPRDIALPCFQIPDDKQERTALILRDNVHAGTYVAQGGDWHVMPDIATHFTVPRQLIWKPLPHELRRPTGREWFEIVKYTDGFQHHRAGAKTLNTYWAGAGYAIEEPTWVVRTYPAYVIGQVRADFEGGRFFTNEGSWVNIEGGDYLIRDGLGPVRAVPTLDMSLEFTRLVWRPRLALQSEPIQDEVVVDFTVPYNPPITIY